MEQEPLQIVGVIEKKEVRHFGIYIYFNCVVQ